jgi:hypothetical protein
MGPMMCAVAAWLAKLFSQVSRQHALHVAASRQSQEPSSWYCFWYYKLCLACLSEAKRKCNARRHSYPNASQRRIENQ